MSLTRKMGKLILIWSVLSSLTGSAAVFTFESLPLSTATPFDDTSDGITASFTSPDAAAFSISPGLLFSTLSGQVLQEVPSPTMHTLQIAFDTPLQSITLQFALNGAQSHTLSIEAWRGSTQVGSASAFGTIPPLGLFPEGTLSFNAGAFDMVQLISTAEDFAVDNIDAVVIPEPASVVLTVAALAALLTASGKRKAA